MPDNRDIRIIYATQSTGIRVFWRLHQAINEFARTGRCGFFITNQYEYYLFQKDHPQFMESNFHLLKEWDVLNHAKEIISPDLETIRSWEARIGDPTFWNTLIIDRRLNYKISAQFRQSYKPAYRHDQLLKILQSGLAAISSQFDAVDPVAVIGLNAVTMFDYLYYLMARYRNIPYFQLKLTRVRNYVSLFTEPFELSPHIKESFDRICSEPDDHDRSSLREAREVLAEARSKALVYEGAINRPGEKKNTATESRANRRFLRFSPKSLRNSLFIDDPHYPSPMMGIAFNRILRPLLRRRKTPLLGTAETETFLQKRQGEFALYPLNTEPEVALLAFGRPYRNQIETVRLVASSLPVGWKLAVKEHPNALGYRSTGFYQKLLDIPNVVVIGPQVRSERLIDQCGLVVLVYGTIGLEAIIKGKPLVVLNPTPYGIFPSHMVRYMDDPWKLGEIIQCLLSDYRYDESLVEAYLAAHIATGIRVNLFTGLLGKGGRETISGQASIEEQYAGLARYACCRINEEFLRLNKTTQAERN
jgi:hypothetical protein